MIDCGGSVFDSTHSALMFAFRFSSEQYGESVLGRLQGRGCGSGKGLVGMDGAGQAGMVLAELGRLEAIEMAALVARYAQRCEPCPCCGSARPTKLWSEAVAVLASWCVPAVVSNLRVRRELIGKFFGHRVEFTDLAQRHGMNRKTVAEHHALICRRLKELEARVQVSADDALKAVGMVRAVAA